MRAYRGILFNEIQKELLLLWSYKFQWIMEWLALFLFFFFLTRLKSSLEAEAALGFLLWFFSVLMVGDISGKISSEFLSGTFEQLYLAATPLSFLIFCKLSSSILRALILIAGMGAALFAYAGMPVGWRELFFFLAALAALFPALFGISLSLAGLTLVAKSTGALPNILNNAFLFLSGIFIPLEQFPRAFQLLAAASPLTLVLQMMREHSLSLFPFVVSLAYFASGALLFYLCEKRARRLGSLGYY